VKFRFQPLRATQAAALLAKLEGGRINYTKMLKLLYLADRRSLVETGRPITGDRVVNMANGPVLSEVYDYVKGQVPEEASWRAFLQTEGRDLVFMKDAGDGELSEYDIELLTELQEQHRGQNFKNLIDEVHLLPEWKMPQGDAKAERLPYEEILRGADVSPETIREYEALNAAMWQMESRRVIRS
jgi:hypothetical protein